MLIKDFHFSHTLSLVALGLESYANWRNVAKADGYHLLPLKEISLFPEAILNRHSCRIPLHSCHGDCPWDVSYTLWIDVLNPSMFILVNHTDICWQAAKMESCRSTTCPIVEGLSSEHFTMIIFPSAFINPLPDPQHVLSRNMTWAKWYPNKILLILIHRWVRCCLVHGIQKIPVPLYLLTEEVKLPYGIPMLWHL